ncbi:xanthine phosphoribosyltransferase [Cellulosilyticum sp. I15G10I2]|uniref:xanthine phosphoribosyltransferase n=1 Tax=Cellulosilyticum sp. I15G10I2 TaxID=1892843 RepID=UPI00085C57CC|nr:xanthine phosphoribosyltransferase [Cellulosilyticum sp. I15G10I2]
MQLLQDKIRSDGTVKPGGVLKVDSFLNHQIDIPLYNEMGKEFARLFKDQGVTKILTIEASGIGIACIAAQYFNVPVVFAKKVQSKNLDGDIYTSQVHSFTHGKEYTIRVSKKFISEEDKVLIIDDFLANGKALIGLIDILDQANATLVGAGIAIEKGFQEGGKALRDKGINIQSLAIIKEMDEERIVFED